MKKFFRKLTVVVGCLLLLICLLSLYNRKQTNKVVAETSILREGTTILAMGDSHASNTLDPSLFLGLVNCGTDGEPMFYTKMKLIYILEKNPQINTVILTMNYFRLSVNQDQHTSKVEGLFNRFAPIINSKLEWQKDFMRNLTLSEIVKMITYHIIGSPTKSLFDDSTKDAALVSFNKDFIGKFNTQDTCRIDSVNTLIRYNHQFGNSILERGVSNFISQNQVKYLYEFFEFCSDNKITVVIFYSPCHSYYNSLIPNEIIEKVDSITSDISEKYQIHIVNWHNLDLPDTLYRDQDHINLEGTQIITPMLRDTLLQLGVIQ